MDPVDVEGTHLDEWDSIRPEALSIPTRPQSNESIRTGIRVADPWSSPAFLRHRALRDASLYVEAHLSGDLSLATLARAVGIERKYFSALFRQQVGIGFKRWVEWCRLHRAVELFQTTDSPVAKVACAVGFRDLRTCERTFARLVGVPPRDCRSRIRGEVSWMRVDLAQTR